MVRRAPAGAAFALLAALALAACGSDPEPAPTSTSRPVGRTLPPQRAEPIAALAPLAGGGLRYGELRSGLIRDRGSRRILARVEVTTRGQRGLLGLAVAEGRTFAAYTARDGRLVVDRVLPRPAARVWTGPATVDLGNGGHLAVLADGRLLIGVGDLGRPSRVADPETLNGKLLALEPRGPAEQLPEVLSGGWNNPFAFAVAPDGRVWVADNAPGRRPERLGNGTAVAPRSPLARPIAPSGLAVLSATDVAVCGVASGTLERYRRAADGSWRALRRFATPCRYGVARLAGGRLIVSGDAGLRDVRG